MVAALGHGPGPYRLIGQSADVGFVTPQDAGQARGLVTQIRSAQAEAGRAAETLHVFADLVVFLAEDAGTAAGRKQRLDDLAGEEFRSDAAVFTGTPAQLAALLQEWQHAGLSGFRLRPGVIPDDLEAITRGLVPELQRRGVVPLSLRGQHPARAARPQPAREPLRPSREELIMTTARKQIHLAAHFPGVNNTTVWSDPRSGSHIEFSSFAHLARTAERAKFDFLFLAEGLRLREQNGLIYDLDVVGRPDTFTVLAALAAVTDRLGLAGTINSTFNEPYEVARQFASLDHLSGGRAAWNVVTSWDAFTGENFRRGGFLPQEARYERARTFLQTAWELFDSWRGDEIVADKVSGVFLADAGAGEFAHADAHFDISGQFNVPRSPQGRPVIFQAGDSADGREFAASSADAIFSRHGTLEDGQAFYADVKGRLARYGRSPDQLLILPAATFVLGDTDAAARELAREVRFQQVSGQTAIRFLEQVWNRDLSGYDPDGPLPDIDPDPGENTVARGRASVRMYRDPLAVAAQWRARAEAGNLSIRELIIEVTGRQTFVGAPATVAGAINTLVQADAADGFILVPHITPGGLDDFADRVVPLLQERGVFRADYEGGTLREHLGLTSATRAGVAS